MTQRPRQKIFLKDLQDQLTPMGYKIVRTDDEDRLFSGQDAMFKKVLKNAALYGEYGVGLSTKWVLRHTDADIVAVDTNEKWIKSVQLECSNDKRLSLTYYDVGTVGDWGRPIDYSRRNDFEKYINAWWTTGIQPDVVLIDGRFRACCFLTSLKYAKLGTRILFDDYSTRPIYHFVEEFAKPVEKCGRQVMFEIDSKQNIDTELLDQTIDQFRFVMD